MLSTRLYSLKGEHLTRFLGPFAEVGYVSDDNPPIAFPFAMVSTTA